MVVPLLREAMALVSDIVRRNHSPLWSPNAAVCNWYEDCEASVAAHADRLTRLGVEPLVAGLSVGAMRVFTLTNRALGKQVHLELPHNSLVLMLPGCQEYWKHAIDKCRAEEVGSHPTSGTGRISVTFRQYYSNLIPPRCHCNEETQLKSVVDAGNANYGRHFWRCSRNSYEETVVTPCDFFAWLDYDEWEKVKQKTSNIH